MKVVKRSAGGALGVPSGLCMRMIAYMFISFVLVALLWDKDQQRARRSSRDPNEAVRRASGTHPEVSCSDCHRQAKPENSPP